LTDAILVLNAGSSSIKFSLFPGEHEPEIRSRVCAQAAWLGLEIDETANAAGGPRITTDSSGASAWMIPTDEDLVIARHARRLIAGGSERGN
jgi:acetate kinase